MEQAHEEAIDIIKGIRRFCDELDACSPRQAGRYRHEFLPSGRSTHSEVILKGGTSVMRVSVVLWLK